MNSSNIHPKIKNPCLESCDCKRTLELLIPVWLRCLAFWSWNARSRNSQPALPCRSWTTGVMGWYRMGSLNHMKHPQSDPIFYSPCPAPRQTKETKNNQQNSSEEARPVDWWSLVLGQGVLNPQRARQDVQWDKRCCRTMAREKEKSAGSNENVLSLLDGLGHFCSPVEQNHKPTSTMRPSSCTAHAFFSAIRARKWRREWGVCGERSKIVQDNSINDNTLMQ